MSKNLQTFIPQPSADECVKVSETSLWIEIPKLVSEMNTWNAQKQFIARFTFFYFYFFDLQQLSGRNLYHLKYEQHDLPIPDIHCNNRSTSLTVQAYRCHPDMSICKSTFSRYGSKSYFLFLWSHSTIGFQLVFLRCTSKKITSELKTAWHRCVSLMKFEF